MDRRHFLITSAAGSGLAAAPPAGKNPVFELRHYRMRNGGQVQRTQDFLGKAYLPAAQRAGIGPLGFFTGVIAQDSPFVLCLAGYSSFAAMESADAAMAADKAFRAASDAYDSSGEPNYVRMESSLFRAFDSTPRIEVPPVEPNRPPRIFELRTYEANSLSASKRKIKMFDDAEIAIFRRVGLLPVFFGESMIGGNQPNLTYMIAFDDLSARDRNWKTFASDPEWQKLRSRPELSDALIVSKISNAILRPLPFSPIR
jgi:hypothetical protein